MKAPVVDSSFQLSIFAQPGYGKPFQASITVQNLTRTFSQANLGKMAIRAVL
jgi:hypothetical protein